MEEILNKLELKPEQKILHLGCANIGFLLELAKRGHKNCCIGDDAGLLIEIKERFKESNLPIRLMKASLADFEISETFDVITSIYPFGLSHFLSTDNIWGKDMGILAKMSETLKEKGNPFVICVLNAYKIMKSSPKGLNLWQLSEPRADGKINRYYTPAELTRMVNRIGLKLDEILSFDLNSFSVSPLNTDSTHLLAFGHKK